LGGRVKGGIFTYRSTIEKTARNLRTDIENGLSAEEAAFRLSSGGKNKLAEKKPPGIIKQFLRQLNDFMVIILLAAAGISIVMTVISGEFDFADPILILLIVALNAVLGVVQENKAERALAALAALSAPTAKVVRSGTTLVIPAEDVVCGDVILLETGDYVPADARITKSVNLKAEESALTGESVPSGKDSDIVFNTEQPIGDRKNMVFSGTSISCGRGEAIVTATGMGAEVGKIASMLMEEDAPETPLQRKLAQVGKTLGTGALVICGVIFVIGILRHIPPFAMFMTSVSLAVAAIPEGLPTIVTIMLAIGVQRMAKRNAIVKKIPAVETLGSATVICSDKTGTLTQNKMKVVEVSDGFSVLAKGNDSRRNALRLASLCNNACFDSKDNSHGDPTEVAIIEAAKFDGLIKSNIDRENIRVAEIPFDSKRKLMSTIHKNGRDFLVATKGAPDFLIERCDYYYENGRRHALDKETRTKIKSENAKMAGMALRVIGVAYKQIDKITEKEDAVESSLTFAGLIGMIDPPRREAADAVQLCKRAGIKPVMITGDHALTAAAIAKKIGIAELHSTAIMTGDELNRISQQELCDHISSYRIFARVSPEHKVRIVKAFQSRGEIVAMTGDGVNDAPALKAADIGCAMGQSGTDVAKGAADMILADDNFATIVDAVREGRGIYDNIKKAAHFLISSNIGEIITIFASMVIGWAQPLLAIHLLWVNLVTDSLPAIALGLDKPESDVMMRKPYSSKAGLFSHGRWGRIAFEGGMIGSLALAAFLAGCSLYSLDVGRTMCFAVLSLSQLVHAFNVRTEKSLFSAGVFGNVYLVGALIAGIILQVGVIMFKPLAQIFQVASLEPYCWLIIALLSLAPLFIVEMEKVIITSIRNK
jgi:Ca2+-transporting ATPase